MADSFKSFTLQGTGTAYTVPTADQNSQPPILPTTTIIKNIIMSNQSGGAVNTTVTMLDSSNSNLEVELYKDSFGDGTENTIQGPIVLEKADQIKLVGADVKILINLMEITA